MSTPNYKYNNILVAIEDNSEDGSDTDFVIENITEELKKKFKNGQIVERWDNDRSYPAKTFFEINFYNSGGEFYKSIEINVRGGYYGGSNFDYEITEISGDLYNQKELKTVENKIQNAVIKVEKILKNAGTELLCVGIFSNGEAIYERKSRFIKSN